MNGTERDQLIDELLEGTITESDFLRIEAELTVDADARQEYYRRNMLSLLLENAASQNAPAQPFSVHERSGTHSQQSVLRNGWAMAIATAVAVLLATLGWFRYFPKSPNNTANAPRFTQEEEQIGYGVLVEQVDAEWDNNLQLADGALLPLDRLQLKAGAVQIELFSGVGLVIEGAADFQIVSAMEVVMDRGKLRASVPEPAHGFTVQTSRGKIVDLGTEFALDVSANQSELHVLNGEIEWHPHNEVANAQRMVSGEGIRYGASGTKDMLPAEPKRFLSQQQLRERSASARINKRKRWQDYSERLRHDERLVAFYQMDSSARWARRLPNLVRNSEQASEGAIVAANRVAGRWAENGAINFNPTGSRIRVNVSTELHSLTLLCWVRINSLDRWYNSLFLTDGHEANEPHWQIMDDGRLFFSVKKRDAWDPAKGEKDKHIFYSPPFWNSTRSGRWLMLATVYDTQLGHVTHYLDGQQLSREAIPPEYLVESVSIGNASLGNWGLPERDDAHFAVRNFNGSMDEFCLFNAALSPDEIKEHYEHGKP